MRTFGANIPTARELVEWTQDRLKVGVGSFLLFFWGRVVSFLFLRSAVGGAKEMFEIF